MIDKYLDEYKNITKVIIKNIDKDEKNVVLMEKREELLNKIFACENNKEEIKKLYLEKGLLQLDKELNEAIQNEILKVKEEMRNLKKIKAANNAYERNRNVNSFFSTKI